jgi:hypothetical protein
MIRGLGYTKGGADEHMGSDSIGNDGLVDAVPDIGGVLSMESAGSRLGPKGLVSLGIDGFFRRKCT